MVRVLPNSCMRRAETIDDFKMIQVHTIQYYKALQHLKQAPLVSHCPDKVVAEAPKNR